MQLQSKKTSESEFRSWGTTNAETEPVDEDIALDAATAKGLGFKTVAVLKGDYRIDRGGSRFGSVLLNVRTTR